MPEATITKLLVDKGSRLYKGPKQFVDFTKNREADELLNDLSNHPHAFVLACIMDRQIKAEKAWVIPWKFREKLGSFAFDVLRKLTQKQIQHLMTKPKPLHRFPEEMSINFYEAIDLISEKYAGKASNIWRDRPSSAELVYRLLEFRGVGQKIGTMAANILVRDFKVPLRDYYSIDVSVDIQVRRVLSRLGLVALDDSIERIVYRARALHPEFPGLLDFPAWEIGRKWCRPSKPLCRECYMKAACPSMPKVANLETNAP
jgi:endonuclease III